MQRDIHLPHKTVKKGGGKYKLEQQSQRESGQPLQERYQYWNLDSKIEQLLQAFNPSDVRLFQDAAGEEGAFEVVQAVVFVQRALLLSDAGDFRPRVGL
mgnify:CR=1 FL=1